MARETSNPVLSRTDVFTRNGYAGFHDAPASGTDVPIAQGGQVGTPTSGQDVGVYTGPTMTINDVIAKTFLMFLVGAVGVGISWSTGFSLALTFVAMFVGLGLAFANIFMKRVSPPLVLAYALAEGVFLGGISAMYQNYVNSGTADGNGTNIVLQAIIGTVTAFAVMLALYSSGKLRATPKFQKMMIAAMISYFAIAVMSFVAAIFFNVGGGFGFYGVGLVGLLLCLAGVLLAAFTLILDFDAIQKGVEAGVPEHESWRASFGLVVTLVWLYLEILRLLAILQR